jgi:hypothetical protein
VFMFSSRQGKADLAAQLFPISIGAGTTPTNLAPTLCKRTSPTSITVTSPNGGETYELSDNFHASWTTCNIANAAAYGAQAFIVDMANPSVMYSVGQGESGFGTTIMHTSSIAQAPSLGSKNFKVKVIQLDQNNMPTAMVDWSDGLFTINKPVTASGATMQSTLINSGTQLMSGPGSSDDTGVFKIRFSVSAANGDVYISRNAVGVPQAVEYMFQKNGAIANLPQGSTAVLTDLTSANITPGNNYRIPNGQTHVFELTAVLSLYAQGQAWAYRFRITGNVIV